MYISDEHKKLSVNFFTSQKCFDPSSCARVDQAKQVYAQDSIFLFLFNAFQDTSW